MTATQLRARLAALGLSSRGGAALCGVHERTMRHWLDGSRGVPEPAVRLLTLLDVPGVREALDGMQDAA